MYRRQIADGLSGDQRAALKARVSLCERFSEKIALEPLPGGGLVAHWNQKTAALSKALGSSGSGGAASSFIAPIPSWCGRFRQASSRRDETLCNALHRVHQVEHQGGNHSALRLPPGRQRAEYPPRYPIWPTEAEVVESVWVKARYLSSMVPRRVHTPRQPARLPHKWHKSTPDPLLVVGISGQIPDEQAFLIKESPHQKWNHH